MELLLVGKLWDVCLVNFFMVGVFFFFNKLWNMFYVFIIVIVDIIYMKIGNFKYWKIVNFCIIDSYIIEKNI